MGDFQSDFRRPDGGINTVEGIVSGNRALQLERKRQRDQEEYEKRKRQLIHGNEEHDDQQHDESGGGCGSSGRGRLLPKSIESKFARDVTSMKMTTTTTMTSSSGKSTNAMMMTTTVTNVGLQTAEEFKANGELSGQKQHRGDNDSVDKEISKKEKKEKKKRNKMRLKEKKKLMSTLSFAHDDDDDGNEDDEEGGGEGENDDSDDERRKRVIKKNPNVDTSFLADPERDAAIMKERERLRLEWMEKQDQAKERPLEITYSYWDGTGHRRSVIVKQGDTIGAFLELCRRDLCAEFHELRRHCTSADNLIYVKEDLILPSDITFYDLIATKARGKSGPLFHFDVHDDIRLGPIDTRIEKDESHPGKVIERVWYERNKHIFPASRWEIYDPSKDYGTYTIGGNEVNKKK